ncbi:MAG: antibiotic biosynthesis monooxygenase family protein [Ktedonobacteraceae bacterium]
MYARVVFTHVEADKEDAVIQLYNESVVPATMQQPGFKGLLHLIDRSKGRGISITFWETEDEMLAGESSGYYQEQLDKFKDNLSVPPTREVYEVNAKVL